MTGRQRRGRARDAGTDETGTDETGPDEAMEQAGDAGEAGDTEETEESTSGGQVHNGVRRRGFLSRPSLRMTEREQQLGRWLAAATAIVYPAIWLGSAEGEVRWFAVVGLAYAALLWAAVRKGHRILAALVAYVAFLGPWGGLFLLAAPHMAYAFWLGFRASRSAREERDAVRAGAAGTRRTAAPADAPSRSPKSTGRPSQITSGRYTPPKPKRRRR